MAATNFVRGSVLRCSFPYVDRPSRPGPHPHYCLFVDSFEIRDRIYYAVCYGTSRLDEPLLENHNGAIFSVDSSLIKGSPMSMRVTHFVCSHVAVIPDRWVYRNFQARLDFIRPEGRKGDRLRERMYDQFVLLEPLMEYEALIAVNYVRKTGRPGLPGETTLR